MFFNFTWFGETEFAELRTRLTKWLQESPELDFFYDKGISSEFERRPATSEDIEKLLATAERGWKAEEYGGCFLHNASQVVGFCSFTLINIKDEAFIRLATLVAPVGAVKFSLYQHPYTHLMLVKLLAEDALPTSVYIPYREPDLEERKIIALYNLKYLEQPGDWQGIDGIFEYNRLQNFELPEVEDLIQLKVTVKHPILDSVSGMLSRYSYRQRLLITLNGKEADDGVLKINQNMPIEIRCFLPLTTKEAFDKALAAIQIYLGYYDKIDPLPPLEGERITLQELKELWKSEEVWRVGEHFIITAHAEMQPEEPDDIILLIPQNTSDVFGIERTGPHPTTHVSLLMLQDYINPAEHKTVLDMGTGTGILAIAAAKMGVERLLALDANPLAVSAATEDVALNNLSDKITVELGSIGQIEPSGHIFYSFSTDLQKPSALLETYAPFDVIICNTLPHVIIPHAGRFQAKLRSGGLLLTSGFQITHLEEIVQALSEHDFELVEKKDVNNWLGVVFRKK